MCFESKLKRFNIPIKSLRRSILKCTEFNDIYLEISLINVANNAKLATVMRETQLALCLSLIILEILKILKCIINQSMHTDKNVYIQGVTWSGYKI